MKGVKRMLIQHLEEKQLAQFEKRRKKTTRKQDRNYVQIIDVLDELLRRPAKGQRKAKQKYGSPRAGV